MFFLADLSNDQPVLQFTVDPDPRSVWNVLQTDCPALAGHEPGFDAHSDFALRLTDAKGVSLFASAIVSFNGLTASGFEPGIERHGHVDGTPFGAHVAALLVEHADGGALRNNVDDRLPGAIKVL